jgi:2-polyprenyl-3-methyl-5-hydroxy-6-metoxy-1,4-benzoquinol methylase
MTLTNDLVMRSMRYAEDNFLNDSAKHLQVDKQFIRDHFDLTNKRILDFGSGMGGMSLWYARNWQCYVHGVDIDGHHVQIANHLKEKHEVAHVKFEQRDIVQKPFESGTLFDAIFMNDVAEHIPYPVLSKIFAQLYRCLAPNGQIFVSYPPWQGPYASHVTRVTHLPWCQYLPEKWLLNWVERKNMPITGEHESNLVEAYKGLNQLTHDRLSSIVEPQGFNIEKRLSHSLLRRVPILRGVNPQHFPLHFLVSKEILILNKK